MGNLGYTYTGLSGKTKNDFGHGDGKFITYINVFSNTIADCNLVESVEIDKKQNKVEYGDILFTTSSETPKEVGMSSVYLGNEDNIYLNSFCFGFKPTYKFDNYYIAYILRSVYVRKKIIPLAQGISRYNISKSKMMEIQINLPCMIEQKKIGEFFKQLDNDITLHQRKLEKLGNIKKSMLEKMFPKDENKVPEIRFKGFNDDWEQHKVSEITNFHKQGFYTTESYNDEKKYYLLRGTDLTENKLILKDTPKINATEKDYQAFKAQIGDFLIVRSGTVGTYGIVYEDIPAIFGSYLIDFRFNKNQVINEFFGYFYQSDLFKNQLKMIIQQSANTNINAENIKSTFIKLPSLAEQKKISDYFQNIDHLISLHQRKPIFGNGGN